MQLLTLKRKEEKKKMVGWEWVYHQPEWPAKPIMKYATMPLWYHKLKAPIE